MDLSFHVMIWEFVSRGAILPFICCRKQLIYWGTATLQDLQVKKHAKNSKG